VRDSPPRNVPSYYWFGRGFKDAFEKWTQLTRGNQRDIERYRESRGEREKWTQLTRGNQREIERDRESRGEREKWTQLTRGNQREIERETTHQR